MINVIRAEYLKLRTIRAVWVISVFTVGIPLLLVSFTPMPNAEILLTSSFPSALLMGVIGVMCSTQEYSQGTIRITLAATPQRWKVFVAKVFVMAVTATMLCGAILLVAHLTQGGNSGWNLSDKTANCAAFVAVAVLSAVIGTSLGLLLRSSPGAITAIVLWPTLLETLVAGLVVLVFFDGDTPTWLKLPFTAGFDAVTLGIDSGPVAPGSIIAAGSISRIAGLSYLGGFAAILVIVSVTLFGRRDA